MSSRSDASGVSAWSWLGDFLATQRVSISFLIFSLLVLHDLGAGKRVRDPCNVGDPWAVFGLVLVSLGLALRSWAAGVLHKGHELATTGPYQLCRHPLYLGSMLLMSGFCLLVADAANGLVVAALLCIVYLPTIRREETKLAARHGESWRAFARTSPAILPCRWPRRLASAWSWRQWLRNREYNAVAASLAALLGLHVWANN
ncbi:MAG: isoprenylcysteine carboxylmethyltransferase family protein [Pirellulales bacterium]|nr:isoprenylcysteine carboxylmethyltransferase family protein [Pirellulales bacterium]